MLGVRHPDVCWRPCLKQHSLIRRTSSLCSDWPVPGSSRHSCLQGKDGLGGEPGTASKVPRIYLSSQMHTDKSVCAGEACSVAQMKDSLRNSPTRGSELMTGAVHLLPKCVIKSTCKARLCKYICSPKCSSVQLGNISKSESSQRRKFLGFLCVRNRPVACSRRGQTR